MNKNIPITIEIRGKSYKGYLQTTDIADPPKVFFVVLNNLIVGVLACYDNWIFDQGGRSKLLGILNAGELNFIAQYLGNIAVEAYDVTGNNSLESQ